VFDAGRSIETLAAPEHDRPIQCHTESQPTCNCTIESSTKEANRSDDEQRQPNDGVRQTNRSIDFHDDGINQSAGIL
jgi:hypothetical protein